MKIRPHLLSATVAALIVSPIAFARVARAQDAPSNPQQNFENPTQFGGLHQTAQHSSYHWVENGGMDDSACLVIEREDKDNYQTCGIINLKNPEPGTYRVSADMKVEEFGQGSAEGFVYIDLYNGDEHVPLNPPGISSGPTGGAWVKVEGEVVVPEGITDGWVGATITKGYTGKVSIDNLVFEKVE
jgi:hypothetical protein